MNFRAEWLGWNNSFCGAIPPAVDTAQAVAFTCKSEGRAASHTHVILIRRRNIIIGKKCVSPTCISNSAGRLNQANYRMKTFFAFSCFYAGWCPPPPSVSSMAPIMIKFNAEVNLQHRRFHFLIFLMYKMKRRLNWQYWRFTFEICTISSSLLFYVAGFFVFITSLLSW